MKKRISIQLAAAGLLLLATGCESDSDWMYTLTTSKQERLIELARHGSSPAQTELGQQALLGYGEGGVDYQAATDYFREAALGNHPAAIYYQAVMLENGWGTPLPDRQRADKLYEVVIPQLSEYARQKNLTSLYLLGDACEHGRGLKEDLPRAVELYRFCVEENFVPAKMKLGILYLEGRGVERDLAKAAELLLPAAEAGYAEAEYALSRAYREQGKTTPAVNWLERAMKKKYPPAIFAAYEHLKDTADESRRTRAEQLLKLAADLNYPPALLEIYASQPGEQRTPEAIAYLTRAAERGILPAMLALADDYKNAITPNPVQAMVLAQMALRREPENTEAQALLDRLDQDSALYYPVRFTWDDRLLPENLAMGESGVNRFIDGWKHDIAGSDQLFAEAVREFPLSFYLANDYLRLLEEKMPAAWLEVYFTGIAAEQEQPGFWLAYSLAAGLAGQGGCQAYGAAELRKRAERLPDEDVKKQELLTLARLLKANALMLSGQPDEAYGELLLGGAPTVDDEGKLICFINRFCRPLLLNKEKFSAAVGLPVDLLGEYALPFRREFYDLEHRQRILKPEQPPEPDLAPAP